MSAFLSNAHAVRPFAEKWKHKEEKDNFEQNFDAEIVRRDKRRELELEVRRDVDTAMREELDRLKDVSRASRTQH